MQKPLRNLRSFAIVLATLIGCLAIIYFSIPMGDLSRANSM